MEVSSNTNSGIDANRIFNPAAVVNTTGRSGGGGSGKVASHVKAHISQLSITRAANGDPRMSAETSAAIRDGAPAPVVHRQVQKQAPETTEDINMDSVDAVVKTVTTNITPTAQPVLVETSSISNSNSLSSSPSNSSLAPTLGLHIDISV